MEISGLTKEEKEKIVRYLMRCYREAKFNVDYLETCSLVSEKMEEYRSEKLTCLMVEKGLNEMREELRELFVAEFVEKKGLNEVLDKYSRSNYYRLRNQAVDEFLHCLQS